METKNSINKIELAAFVLGTATGLLGLVVIFGWFINSTLLTQIFPDFAPMQFNTALSFLLCGVALLAIGKDKTLYSRIAALALLFLVTLTAFEYMFGISLGIDKLFITPPEEQANTLFSGRMSPPTTISFLLCGTVLLLLSFKKAQKEFPVLMGLMLSLVFALSFSTIIGHTLQFEVTDNRIKLLGMALHTSFGFLFVSVGAFLFAIGGEIRHKGILPNWISAPIAVVIMCVAVVMWQSLLTQEHVNLKSYMRLQSNSIKNILNEKLTLHFNALQRMAYRLENFKQLSRQDWKKDVALFLTHFNSYRAVIHRDANLQIVNQVFDSAFNENFQLLTFDDLKTLRAKSRKDSQFVFTRTPGKDGVAEVFLIVPLFNKTKFDGFVGAVLEAKEFLDFGLAIENNVYYSIKFHLDSSNFDLFAYGRQPRNQDLITRVNYSDIRGNWEISSWPTEKLIDRISTKLPLVVLIGGLMLSIMAFLLVHFGITAQNRSYEMAELNQSLEKKVAERTKEILERDEFNRRWLSKCTDGAWYWDLEKNTVFMTPQFKSMLGYEVNEISDSVDIWRKLVPPMDLQVADQAYQDYVKNGKPYSYQIRWRHKNGTMIWTLCRGEGIRNESGEIVQMVGTLTNISQIKQMEEELTRWTEELERKNAEMGRFNRLAVGREKRMIELKSKINELSRELGRAEPYNLNFKSNLDEVGKVNV